MRFSPPLQVLERGPGGEVSESPELKKIYMKRAVEIIDELFPDGSDKQEENDDQ